VLDEVNDVDGMKEEVYALHEDTDGRARVTTDKELVLGLHVD